MTVRVEALPPPPDPSSTGAPGDTGPAPGAAGDAPPADQLTGEWTVEDLQRLCELISLPYAKIAESTAEAWIALTSMEATLIATPMTSWLPVSWVRGVKGQEIPPLLGVILTAAVVAGVTSLKILHWNREHPDQFIRVPIIATRRPPRGPAPGPRPTEPRPRSDDGSAGTADRAGTEEVPAEPVAADRDAGSVDGGPPADSLDDIRRAYRH